MTPTEHSPKAPHSTGRFALLRGLLRAKGSSAPTTNPTNQILQGPPTAAITFTRNNNLGSRHVKSGKPARRGNHLARLRSLIVTCLLSLVTLGIAAAPALAKNERVYTAVFGGEVNKTKVTEKEEGKPVTEAEENVCTVASGDECQPGKPGEGPGQFKRPEGIAVNDETGDVYVIDAKRAEANEARVQEFNEAGEYLTEFPRIPATATGIAVDNCKNVLDEPCSKLEDPSVGDVYVAGSFGQGGVYKFTADGVPLVGIKTGNNDHGVAVDPEGKVWVSARDEIESYSDAEPNVFVSSVDLQEHRGSEYYGHSEHGDTYSGLAVDSKDDSYLLSGSGIFGKLNSSGEVLIREVDQEPARAAAVDQASDDVYVDNRGSIAELGPAPGCTVVDPCQTDPEQIERFGVGYLSESVGVAVDPATETVYASNLTGDDVDVFVKALVPDLIAAEPTKPETEGSLTLNGKVDPEGVEVKTCEFEYGPTSSYGQSRPCPAGIVGSSASAELPVSVEVSGLTPDTLYHYRLVAGYAGQNEVDYGPDQTFVAGALPVISEEKIEGVSSGEATLSAAINPGGLVTTYDVEYGPCPEPYEQAACVAAPYPSSTPQASAGAGFTSTGVRVRLRGLQAGTYYHARVLASNAIDGGAPAPGGVLVFTTVSSTGPSSSALPDDRTYELVSPATGDADVYVPTAMEEGFTTLAGEHGIPTGYPSEAAADGDAVVYYGNPGATGGNGSFQHAHGNGYLATRSPGGGWTAVNTSTPGGRPGFDLQGAPLPNPFVLANAGTSAVPAATHTLTLGKGADDEVVGDLFDDLGGTSIQVNVLPDGDIEPDAQFGSAEPLGNGFFKPDTSHAISADGSRIYWSAVEEVEEKTEGVSQTVFHSKELYVRLNDTQPQSPLKGARCTVPTDACTVQVDARQGGPGASGGGRFLTASANGELVFFTDASRLTIQSTAAPEEPDLYEYDLGAPLGKRLTDLTVAAHSGEHADVQGLVGSSEDGSYLYFVAHGVLASNKNSEEAEPVPGGDNLYLYHAGSTTFVATLSGGDNSFGNPISLINGDWRADPGLRTAQVTPDGHSLTFMSRAPLTVYDSEVAFPQGKQDLAEVFVYDANTAQLSCASCDPGVSPVVPAPIRAIATANDPTGSELWGSFLPTGYSKVGYQSRLLSDDGDRVFFSSFEPLVPQATNGWLDVYEWEREGTESTPGSHFSSCPVTNPARSSGGCVFLISSPSSNENSYLLETDATGENAFFITRAALVPADRGGDRDLLYDARVDGYEPPAQATCSGTGCQGVPPPPPIFATPSSVTFNGIGNFPPPTPTVVKPKVETKAEKLTKALKVCHKDKKKTKRVACEKQAQKHYGVAKKSAKRATNDRRGK